MSDEAGVTLRLPRVLQADAGGQRTLSLPVPAGGDLAGLLEGLRRTHPALERRLRDEQGRLRRHVNVYVEGTEVRRGEGLATPTGAGTSVEVLQSIAGG